MNTHSSEDKFAAKVRQALSESANQLDSGTLLKLERARNLALARHKPGSSVQAVLMGKNSRALGNFGFSGLFRTAAWATPVLALVVGLVILQDWQSQSENSELASIDTEVLTDDLPLNAYLDQGFNRYLLQGE